jgi:hypothetical protein
LADRDVSEGCRGRISINDVRYLGRRSETKEAANLEGVRIKFSDISDGWDCIKVVRGGDPLSGAHDGGLNTSGLEIILLTGAMYF